MIVPTALGSIVRVADGRIGTVVYNSLIGVGIKWGRHNPHPSDFVGTNGDLLDGVEVPDDWPWTPDALLRDPWQGSADYGFSAEQCVGAPTELHRYGREVIEKGGE